MSILRTLADAALVCVLSLLFFAAIANLMVVASAVDHMTDKTKED